MKRSSLSLFVLLLSFILCAQNFTHSTYLVGHSLNNAEAIKQINYSQFQYIYLMAAPKWNEVDFNQPENKLVKELVTKHKYIKDHQIEVIPLLIDEAHKNGTKVLLSFAGDGFRKKVESLEQRKKFIRIMMLFIDKYNYDGIEIDWESDLSLPLHAEFIADIRTELNKLETKQNRHLYLTTALHSWQVYDKEIADKLSPNVDWINIMTYDMGGGIWGYVPEHNTPLDKIEKELKNWNVFDKSKLCLGLANYGFIYKNIKPGEKMKDKLEKYGSYISYNEALPLLKDGWKEEYDDKAKVSYYFAPDKSAFVTMENKNTILTKMDWITKENYRGVFWWEFSYDIINPENSSSKIKHHLIDVVSEYLDN